jgi:hypothetical protein
MALHRHKLSVTPVGTHGSGTGSASVVLSRYGELHSVFINYAATVTGNLTCVRLQTADATVNIFEKNTNSTDSWYFPRETVSTITGTSYSSLATALVMYPAVGTLVMRVGSSAPRTDAVTAYVFLREE